MTTSSQELVEFITLCYMFASSVAVVSYIYNDFPSDFVTSRLMYRGLHIDSGCLIGSANTIGRRMA